MLNINYSITTNLLQTLKDIETLRAQLLLTAIPMDVEMKIRWQVNVSRIFWSLKLNNNPLVKQQVNKLLMSDNKKIGLYEKQVIDYKKALDYIKYEWLAKNSPITASDVVKINKLACNGKLIISQEEIERLLNYLQVSQDNPIIQAAIGHYQLLYMAPFSLGNEMTSRLFTYLILYNHGLNFREFLVLDEYFYETPKAYEYNFRTTQENGNINPWLDYFASGVANQLKKIADLISKERTDIVINPFWKLTDRQREILSLLEQPERSLTNKKVQKLFKISQITASRDLSKLAKLGLIRSQGQGRSIYYTKY